MRQDTSQDKSILKDRHLCKKECDLCRAKEQHSLAGQHPPVQRSQSLPFAHEHQTRNMSAEKSGLL